MLTFTYLVFYQKWWTWLLSIAVDIVGILYVLLPHALHQPIMQVYELFLAVQKVLPFIFSPSLVLRLMFSLSKVSAGQVWFMLNCTYTSSMLGIEVEKSQNTSGKVVFKVAFLLEKDNLFPRTPSIYWPVCRLGYPICLAWMTLGILTV